MPKGGFLRVCEEQRDGSILPFAGISETDVGRVGCAARTKDPRSLAAETRAGQLSVLVSTASQRVIVWILGRREREIAGIRAVRARSDCAWSVHP
jgi:hypothetical protein